MTSFETHTYKTRNGKWLARLRYTDEGVAKQRQITIEPPGDAEGFSSLMLAMGAAAVVAESLMAGTVKFDDKEMVAVFR